MKPLKFYSHPQYLRFGGNLLKEGACKIKQPLKDEPLAEAWEISDHKLHSSIVSHGEFKDKTLRELITDYKDEIMGKSKLLSDGLFPLMIRILDINENLPPAAHPDEKYAVLNALNDHGKHEAAYVLHAEKNAKFYYGIKEEIALKNPEDFSRTGKSFSIMNEFNVNAGECFYVKPGVLHSWGKGALIYEVHTTSNLIFALDWLSWDKDAERREQDLNHLKKILINSSKNEAALKPVAGKNEKYKKETLYSSNMFVLEKISFRGQIKISGEENRFAVYTIIEGRGTLSDGRGDVFNLEKFETALIPASCKDASFKSRGEAVFLKVYIP